jgi:hypothetical protein
MIAMKKYLYSIAESSKDRGTDSTSLMNCQGALVPIGRWNKNMLRLYQLQRPAAIRVTCDQNHGDDQQNDENQEVGKHEGSLV